MWIADYRRRQKERKKMSDHKCSGKCFAEAVNEGKPSYPCKDCTDIHPGLKCNPPKSEGPYKVNEYGNVVNSMDGTIHWCGKYGDDVCLALNIAHHEGRASLIPLVRELAQSLKDVRSYSNAPIFLEETADELLAKAKKEIEK
jgi:hypothetical protein